jgi:hypothetical protein
VGKGLSSGKIRPTWETASTMRTWVVTKASKAQSGSLVDQNHMSGG